MTARVTIITTAVATAIAAVGFTAPAFADSFNFTYTAQSPQEAAALASGLKAYFGQQSGAAINQSGTGNAAGIAQSGSGNTGIIDQAGSNQSATLHQNGNGGTYATVQIGNGSSANVGQNGNGQAGFTVQANW